MIIVSAQYVKGEDGNNNGVIVKNEKDVYIGVPMDTANTDYQQVLEWVAAGNTIQAAD